MLYKKRNRTGMMCNLNVTPMVDVMLVLLVVFMVTSPMLMSNVDINLPKSGSQSTESQHFEPIVVVIDSKGSLYLKDNPVAQKDLLNQIVLWSNGDKDIDVHIHGDQGINYGRIMETISLINDAGYRRVSLVATTDAG
ncbi:biopolymer transport protein ExbD [Candidatus Xenohaliotis californiensis]|uniref:Biopolymer transport protein ExbD n=1 Tax=Candidatus Xenohaliotis californiensis TaxID=84677 RepID=A0ABP0EV91_9RICK|nr:biopolymer transport protein ExbD [Candidatus Xenohaliotis californiensis]